MLHHRKSGISVKRNFRHSFWISKSEILLDDVMTSLFVSINSNFKQILTKLSECQNPDFTLHLRLHI